MSERVVKSETPGFIKLVSSPPMKPSLGTVAAIKVRLSLARRNLRRCRGVEERVQ